MIRRLMLPAASALSLVLILVEKASASSFKFFILYEPTTPRAVEK